MKILAAALQMPRSGMARVLWQWLKTLPTVRAGKGGCRGVSNRLQIAAGRVETAAKAFRIHPPSLRLWRVTLSPASGHCFKMK